MEKENANKQGRFRRKKSNFSQISNAALWDTNLSLTAKGLYSIIASLINIPDFVLYKTTLQKKAGLGRDAFNRYWKELKDFGYLLQFEMRDEKGHMYYEYELLDEPNSSSDNPSSNNPTNKENDNRVREAGDGFSVYGVAGTSKSDTNNIYINNNNLNNTYTVNSNSKESKSSKEDIINDFYYKTSDVDFSEISNFSSKSEKLDKFLHNLNEEELLYIQKLDKPSSECFYLTVMNSLFEDCKIHNKEGYLRTVLKDIDSFNDSYVNKLLRNEYQEIYDDSNNVLITSEEQEAFYRLRGEQL